MFLINFFDFLFQFPNPENENPSAICSKIIVGSSKN